MIYDRLKGNDQWKLKKETHLYDWQVIETKLTSMCQLREAKDIEGLVYFLR